jgi:hypothetical protein
MLDVRIWHNHAGVILALTGVRSIILKRENLACPPIRNPRDAPDLSTHRYKMMISRSGCTQQVVTGIWVER